MIVGGHVSNTGPASQEKEFHGLELLRFLCALSVVVWHYRNFIPGGGDEAGHLIPFHGLFYLFYNWGNYAVEVFWAISGFIFFWKYSESINSGRVNAISFFILRFSRLYPLHIFTLLLVTGLQFSYISGHGTTLQYRFFDIHHFVLHLFFASDWGLGGGLSFKKPDWDAGMSFNGPVWSISVEVLAYAVFWILARKGPFTALRLVKIMAVLIVARMALPWIKDILTCQVYFFIGGAVYLLVSQGWAANRLIRSTGIAVLLAATALFGNTLTEGKIHTITLIWVTVALLLIFLSLGTIIKSRRLAGWFCGLGNLTYSSYMIHFPLQIAVVLGVEQMGMSPVIYSHWAILVGFLSLTFLLSHVSYVYFEHPAQNWLRRRLGRAALPRPTRPDTRLG